MFAHPCRPICALFSLVFFYFFIQLLSILAPNFVSFNLFFVAYLAAFPVLYFLRPFRDFLLLSVFYHHIAYLGSPCTLGCNPVVHASWAVAGWVIYGYVPAKWGVDVDGVWRRWRSFKISSAVRVVVCGGGCGSEGGGVVCLVGWWRGRVVWLGKCGCVCVVMCVGGLVVDRELWWECGVEVKCGRSGCWWWCVGRVHLGWWDLGYWRCWGGCLVHRCDYCGGGRCLCCGAAVPVIFNISWSV
jgi:hypothetical protein